MRRCEGKKTGLEETLKDKRSEIIERWFELITDNYHEDTAQFLKNEKDRFLNPVGYITFEGISEIFDGLSESIVCESTVKAIDDIIRVRAVQGFRPSQAIEFIFLLKRVLKEVLDRQIPLDDDRDELQGLEARIDRMALIAFDIYMGCREQINNIRKNELRAEKEMAMKFQRLSTQVK